MVRLAWPGWWLGLLVGAGSPVAAQANVLPPRVELKENYPNPFFPVTTIPFEISQEVCARGHQPVVSLKIYNVLVQMVAIPVLADGSAERLDSLRLRCGGRIASRAGMAVSRGSATRKGLPRFQVPCRSSGERPSGNFSRYSGGE